MNNLKKYFEKIELAIKSIEGSYDKLLEAEKNIKIIKNLENEIITWMKRGVSASSLIKYISCSLSFYYHYIAKIIPKKED